LSALELQPKDVTQMEKEMFLIAHAVSDRIGDFGDRTNRERGYGLKEEAPFEWGFAGEVD
jgi:hypothetical protein